MEEPDGVISNLRWSRIPPPQIERRMDQGLREREEEGRIGGSADWAMRDILIIGSLWRLRPSAVGSMVTVERGIVSAEEMVSMEKRKEAHFVSF